VEVLGLLERLQMLVHKPEPAALGQAGVGRLSMGPEAGVGGSPHNP